MTKVTQAVRDAKWARVPLADLTNPRKRGPLMTYQDHWWAVDENDNVFFFNGKSYSPQCNTNRLIVERHLAQGVMHRIEPGAVLNDDAIEAAHAATEVGTDERFDADDPFAFARGRSPPS
mgnify:CR=1 FL=1